MAIAVTSRASVHDTTAGTTYTASPTWTPAVNSLLLIFVASSNDTNLPISVTGHGVAYTQIATVAHGTTTGHTTLYAAKAGASPTSVAGSATWGPSRSGVSLIEAEVTGHDSSLALAVGASQMFPQAPTNTGSATSRSVTLAAATAAGNRPIAVFQHTANEGTIPGTAGPS